MRVADLLQQRQALEEARLTGLDEMQGALQQTSDYLSTFVLPPPPPPPVRVISPKKRRNAAIAILGEINDGYLERGYATRPVESLEQQIEYELPRAITQLWGGELDGISLADISLGEQWDIYKTLRDTRNELADYIDYEYYDEVSIGEISRASAAVSRSV